MKRYSSSVLLLCFFALLLLLAPRSAWAAKYGKVTVDAIPLYETHDETQRGYAGYLFQVKNNDNKPHVVQVKIPNETYRYGSSSILSDTRSVKLAAGQSSHIWIYQPAIMMANSNALVTIDGQPYPKRPIPVDVMHTEFSGDGYGNNYNTIATPEQEAISIKDIAEGDPEEESSLPPDAESNADMGMLMPGGGRTPGLNMAVLASRGLSGNLRDQVSKLLGNCNMVRSAQKTAAWPTNWIAYSQFDGIMLTDIDFDTLPPEAVTALADYLSVGGTIWIRSDTKPKPQTTPQLEELKRAADGGMGMLLTGQRDGRVFKKHMIKWIQCANQCQEASQAAKTLPAIDRSATPVRLFLVMLIFYALLIGPALQVILKIKRRRIWMLWIIPVASLVLCVVVFVGSYLAEGFDGFANFRNITVLDQKNGRASTVGWASFYSPLTDGAGLKFSTATILQPQWQTQGWGNNTDTHYVSIDWTAGQHFTSGWLLAKTPISFRLWKAEARREKLVVRKDEQGNFTVTNALGADAEGLKLCMPDGTWYAAEKILAGKTSTLNKIATPTLGNLPDIKEYCSQASNWTLNDHEHAERMRVNLESGTYQVMVHGHPFVNTAITNPAQDQGKTLVLGRFEVEE